MKRLFIIVVVLFFSTAVVLVAQESKEEKPKKVKQPVNVDVGNMLIIYGGINYSVAGSPYGSVGLGYDFQLNNNMVISPTIKMIKTQVSAGTDFTGATSVEGGEINYIDIGLALKYFLQKSWWVSGGFIFEPFLNGYYIDNTGTATLFVALDRTDELNNLALHFATGLYSAIRPGVYIIPSGSLRINLPNSSDYDFSSDDVIFGIDLGIGIQM